MEEEYISFPSRKEEDGTTSILLSGYVLEGRENPVIVRNVHQTKEGGDIYGKIDDEGCCIANIDNNIVIITCKKTEN